MAYEMSHTPVMIHEVLDALAPVGGEIYVDGTFGAGGYSQAILEANGNCQVVAIDRDPNVAQFAGVLAEQYKGRFDYIPGSFGDMQHLLASQNLRSVHGIVLDLGVSSMQLDQGERGFSFSKSGPLDMRMSQVGQSAADLVNQESVDALADIFRRYGEEKQSKRIARALVEAREAKLIETTDELANIVYKVLGRGKHGQKDPATRTFQALRIKVNDELGELERVLMAAEMLLAPGGRLVVVVFHSLEDRIVKKFLQLRSGNTGGVSRHMPKAIDKGASPTFSLPKPWIITPGEEEINMNPRARSAKLRVGFRL